MTNAERLEQYTLRIPTEVLLVHAETEGTPDQIVVFKGYSSSLMCATAADPSVPVLAANADIQTIDRLRAPFTPQSPVYLERQIPWPVFTARLTDLGL